MNEHIKFRAWNEEENKMIEWCDTFFSDMSEVTSWSSYFSYIDMKLLRYTGINDINGKEIYEGDIVKHEDLSIGCTVDLNITGQVKMVDGSWCVENGDKGEFLFTEIGTNEIIGNIYENHELLET